MPSQHSGEQLGVRAPKDVRDAARTVLDGRDLKLSEFVVACLRALVATPDSVLRSLKPYWPEPPTKGVKKAEPTPKPSQKGKR